MRSKSILVVVMVLVLGMGRSLSANIIWDWDSGTTEGWYPIYGAVLTVEPGRGEGYSVGLQNAILPVHHFPDMEVAGLSIDPGFLVGGQIGDYLPMTQEFYVDMDRLTALQIWIGGETTNAWFIANEFGLGSVENLEDGWYRYYLGNRHHYPADYSMPGTYRAEAGEIWFMIKETTELVRIDNLTIVPEPSTLLLLGLGAVMLRKRCLQ